MAHVSNPDFVQRVADKTKLSTRKAEKVVKTVMSEIKSIVDNGDTVSFYMIGRFYPGILSPTRSYNPKRNRLKITCSVYS